MALKVIDKTKGASTKKKADKTGELLDEKIKKPGNIGDKFARTVAAAAKNTVAFKKGTSTGKLASDNPTQKSNTKKQTTTDPSQKQSLQVQAANKSASTGKLPGENTAQKSPTKKQTTTDPSLRQTLQIKETNNGGTSSTPATPAAPAKTPEQIAVEQAAAAQAAANERAAEEQAQRDKELAERAEKQAADPYGFFGLQSPEATAKYYEGIVNEYNQRQTELANKQAQARNADYDKQQNENYINYMMAQRALPEQLARLGLSGGASETSQLRANMNYANQRGATNLNRNTEIAGINTNLQNLIANYLAQQNAAMRDENVKNLSELYSRRNAGEMADREYNLAREQADEAARQFYATNLQNAQQFATTSSIDRDRLAEEKRTNQVTEKQNAAQLAETKRQNKVEEEFKKQELALQKAAQAAAKADGDFDKAQKMAATYGTVKKCQSVIKDLSKIKKPTTYQKYLLALTRARMSEIKGDRQKAIEARQDSIILYNKTKK